MGDSTPADLDAGDRAERGAAANGIREEIAEDLAARLRHADREGWGRLLGSPTLSGNVLIYHFESGKRGIIHLPTTADYGKKET